MEISFSFLYTAYQEEKKTNEIQQLPKDFYTSVGFFMKEQENKEGSKEQKQLENIKKIVFGIKNIRKQKILLYIAYDKSIPIKIPEEEENLYYRIKSIMEGEEKNENIKKVKIKLGIPEVISPSGNKIGPFNQNQVVDIINKDDIEFLVSNQIGEIIN
jgi:DNA replication initiation complex subunit (GINS family)